MANETLLHMSGALRESLIDDHKFYINQAQKRLLEQFIDLDCEANAFAVQRLNDDSQYFDPETDDPGDFYERAHEDSIGHYLLLIEMKTSTQLLVAAGMYHEWDKQLRDWLVKEIRHWSASKKVKDVIWSQNFHRIMGLLVGLGWNVKLNDYYVTLNLCRLVVNVYKHGDGAAFRELKDHMEFFGEDIFKGISGLEYKDSVRFKDLQLQDKHIQMFSDAIVDFWGGVPESILDSDDLNPPDWFLNALNIKR